MSGRPRGGPADPEAGLRELTRAAHEAARDLRQALAEARQVSAQLRAEHHEELLAVFAAGITEAGDQLTTVANEVLVHLQREVNRALDHVAGLAGAVGSASELAQTIVDQASLNVAEQLQAQLKLPPGARVQVGNQRRR